MYKDGETVPGQLPVLTAMFYFLELREGAERELDCCIQPISVDAHLKKAERYEEEVLGCLLLSGGETVNSWSQSFAALKLLIPDDENVFWSGLEDAFKEVFKMGLDVGKRSKEAAV